MSTFSVQDGRPTLRIVLRVGVEAVAFTDDQALYVIGLEEQLEGERNQRQHLLEDGEQAIIRSHMNAIFRMKRSMSVLRRCIVAAFFVGLAFWPVIKFLTS